MSSRFRKRFMKHGKPPLPSLEELQRRDADRARAIEAACADAGAVVLLELASDPDAAEDQGK